MDFVKRDIHEVIEECGVELTEYEGQGAKGRYWKGLCPFHDDQNNPSFIVWEQAQWCRCYTCWQRGGDVISFVMKLKNVDFVTAKDMTSFEQTASEALKQRKSKGDLFKPEVSYKPMVRRIKLLASASGIKTPKKARMVGEVLALLQSGSMEQAEEILQQYEQTTI